MPRVETSLDIPASPDQLWAVLGDFSNYPSWNPFITSIRGMLQEGDLLALKVKLPNQDPLDIEVRITELKEAECLRWRSYLGEENQIQGDHYLLLKGPPSGPTQLIHGEAFQGPGAEELVRAMEESTRAGFEAMNTALRKETTARL